MLSRFMLFAAMLLPLPVFAQGPIASKDSWPQWRGPQRNSISTETGLLKEWPKDGPKLLWDAKEVAGPKTVGTGIASLAIVDGRIYTIGDDLIEDPKEKGKRSGDEFVSCHDAETGKLIWKSKVGPFFYNSFGSGGRSTPTVDGDRLYVLSPHGVLFCLEAAKGNIEWQKDLVKDFGGKMMSGWGYSESPTIDGDKVIVTPGGKKAAIVALDKSNGKTIWTCQPPADTGAGYSSVVIAEVGGVKQYVTQLGKELGLVGVDAKTGKFLWNYTKAGNGTAHIQTPIVKDDYVFTSNAYGGGAALVKLVPDGKGGINADEQYYLKPTQLSVHHGGAVMIGDYIYGGHGQNDGKPFCLEWKTGKFAWGPEKSLGKRSAAALYADGNLYFRYEGGTVALIEATPKGLNVKGTFDSHIAREDWPHPVIWHGKLYLRGEDTIRCYDVRR